MLNKKLILVTSNIIGTNYRAVPLLGQPYEKDLTRSIEDLKITAPIAEIAKYPLETVFIATNVDFPEPDHMNFRKEDLVPLFHKDTVFPMSGLTPELITEILDHLMEYMIVSPDYGLEKAKEYSEKFKVYGYTADFEKLTEIPVAGPEGTSVNMKVSLAAKYPVPSKKDIGFHIEPDIWFLMIRNILRGENQLITGPTGSGKTELVKHIANALGRELFTQDMGTIQDVQSSLLGTHRLDETGKSIFDKAPFVDYVQSNGIVLLDEINRAPITAGNVLFPCLDSRRYLPLDIACGAEDRHVNLGEETCFIATANLGTEYSGASSIDRALLDRFFIIEVDYPSKKEEIAILKMRTGVEEKAATAIVNVAQQIRKLYIDQELSNAISVRHTLQAAGLVADGFDCGKALESTVLPLFEAGVGATSERGKVMSIISAY